MSVLSDYLAELVRSQLDGCKANSIPDGVKIEELVHLSHINHMDYLLLGALLKTTGISKEWKEILRNYVMRSIVRTTEQVMEYKEMVRRFEKNEIVSQPMKGAWMKFIYPSPEMREMSDIDVLIKCGYMEKAGEVLKGMGYSLQQAIKHHDIYVKKPFMVIEAHKAMYDKTVDNNQYKYFSDFSKAKLKEGHAYTYDFGVDDFYIYMIAHMAKHFYVMGCGIRNLVDIYVYLNKYEKNMDRQYIDTELKKIGIDIFAKYMEELAITWLERLPFSSFQQQLFDYMLDSGIYGKDENGIWHKFSEEKMKEKSISTKQLKLWYFFPPMTYMTEYYPWLEGKTILLPIAWMIRACRGIFMNKGSKKRKMLHKIEEDKILVYKNIYQKMQLHFK